ncbi:MULTISPECIES: hypothetical protein [unclassified Tolypothrix]|uniref:hypothetical protein n=1 Tax=unclassified Tolypothrix TaxID=2649714 RepID=UPI0005EAA5E8|nr:MULTISPECIES: hypothetical protein [unclassified Tolypothrix]BAY92723.1 hypothetical protein NIES3275_47600 [Microchaete diplosiphon NIES-3275]EKF05832.1 hypothetical protein FDUTEX481_00691 [Tolypothrix sp. PCC 7601]MBE9081481.1 hypothetical protein [Tolypothrix sp. LEGE 11397]UYD26652.1 hypothetical protein HGR01_00545 [Tolypothrix sp. PCC 7712]UYD37489.1 hypothetical protein HG267_18265 [Tolypothrix sp. PCC 7601]
MSQFSVNIANILLTSEQYLKLRIYAETNHISVHEAMRLLVDSLPEPSKNSKKIDKFHPFVLSRKLLQTFFNAQ